MFDIEKRLEKLEKSNRRMKTIAIAATLSCIGAITIAAGSRGGNGWFSTLNVEETLSLNNGANQYIEGGNLYLNYGNLNLNGANQNIEGGSLHLQGANLSLNYGSLIHNKGNQHIIGGSLNIYEGNLNVENGSIYIDGENLSNVLEDLQLQINSLQKELMECCGAVATCPSDLNDDENVGVDDLLTLIADWGECS